eukprot:15461442-Alexandrium_andersonii.AAC.1
MAIATNKNHIIQTRSGNAEGCSHRPDLRTRKSIVRKRSADHTQLATLAVKDLRLCFKCGLLERSDVPGQRGCGRAPAGCA